MSETNPSTTPEKAAVISRQRASEFEIVGLLYLYKITLSDGSIARLFATGERMATVTFQNQTYHSHPIEAGGFTWSPNQPDRQPVLRLSHHDLPAGFSPDFDNVRGGHVERLITFAEECAPPIGTNGASSFPPETWQIDRLEARDEAIIQLALQPVANLQGEMLPKRVVLRDVCQHRYRHYDEETQDFDYRQATCPYSAARYYTATGAPTTDKAQDSCSLRLESGCKKRYGDNLPFFGFPGLAR